MLYQVFDGTVENKNSYFIAEILGEDKGIGIWLEFPLQLLAIGVAIGIMGPGSYSLDTLFGIALPDTLLFCVLAFVGLLVDITGLFISHQPATTSTEVKSTT